MKSYKGTRVFEGYALGKVRVYSAPKVVENNEYLGEKEELDRFYKAREETISSLDASYLDTLSKLGEEEAQLFATHKLMAEDLDFEDLVKENVVSGLPAEKAVDEAGKALEAMFLMMDDEYMKARGKDVKEVASKIIAFMSDDKDAFTLTEPSIIICDDLPSSELMRFDKRMVLGVVYARGGSNSHVAILTRMLELPGLCDLPTLEVDESLEGSFAILDCNKSQLILSPSSKDIESYGKLKKEYEENRAKLEVYRGKKTVTKDGHELKIYSNIASSYEVENALRNDAEGIGLFRSEFIYLEAKDYPTEEEQFIHYKRVVEAMGERQVIIRTLDIGADKKIDYFDLPPEENPALGFRSIRICKERPEILAVQLQALYRASAYGNLAVMIPMIISESEVKFVHEMALMAQHNLDARGIPYNKDMKIGIMVETPSSAIISDILAKQVDFFSIGTNDLSQYTLAIDRVNTHISSCFDPHHKAICRLIKMATENAHKAGIPIGICGELARDAVLLPFFLKIGVDELSVSPAYVLSLRAQIAEIDTREVDVDSFIN